jgi:hypothetical protein
MYGSVVVVLNIGKTLILCVGVLGIVHAQDMHDHPVDDLGLAICLDQRLDQNMLRNRLSRSEIIVCGIPKCTHIRSKKSLGVAFIVMLFFQAAIIAILEKRSTTTKTQSFLLLVRRPNM